MYNNNNMENIANVPLRLTKCYKVLLEVKLIKSEVKPRKEEEIKYRKSFR